MGVTFTATAAVTGYQMICCDGEHRDARTWPAGTLVARIEREHAAGCVDPTCIDYQGGTLEPIYAVPIEPVEVGQVNARRVLDALGYPTSPDGIGSNDPFEPFDNATGEAGAADFAGRVLTALALSPDDTGMPGTDEYDSRGTRWVGFGWRPGYLQDTLGRLRSLAEVARAHNLTITWA